VQERAADIVKRLADEEVGLSSGAFVLCLKHVVMFRLDVWCWLISLGVPGRTMSLA
jgi:hypothetical protein